MLFKSKIKWAALIGLVLSLLSLGVHLFLTKFSNMGFAHYAAIGFGEDFATTISTQSIQFRKLWGGVKPLESLKPYANPRSSFPAPNKKNNGFIYAKPPKASHLLKTALAKVSGNFEKIRSSICDLVAISRLLNATLVIPEIQEATRSKGISYKFNSFSYLYDEDLFIASLTNDVKIIKSLPENLKASRKKNEYPIFKPKSSSSPSFYIKEVLPKLKKAKVIGLVLTDGGGLQSILPSNMYEHQRLRCRVSFHALHFRPEIQMLGRRMVQRLRAWGQPYLVYHPGLVRDILAYHGCAELFQDIHTELIQYRRAQMIKRGIIKEELNIDSHLRRENGSCPLMPEEVGILLRAMGYTPKTIIYLSGSEVFGGQRALIPFRAMFANSVDRTSLCSKQELLNVIGPSTPLPEDVYDLPPPKSEEQLKEEWNKAGPRPRPLPPPPERPIYRHEKEGWYGWITESETEPELSPAEMRVRSHRLLWDALDYIVSVEADAFFPGYNNYGTGGPDFSSLVMGQRLYEIATSRTYRPDRKILAELFNSTRDNMYHPKRNWTLSVQEHLNRSLGQDGIIQQSLLTKPYSFLSHPLPECSCRVPSIEVWNQVKDIDGRFLYGGEDKCPEWMEHGLDTSFVGLAGTDTGAVIDESDSSEYEIDTDEQPESVDSYSKFNSQLDQEEEADLSD